MARNHTSEVKASRVLSLAAAPTFGVMAALTGAFDTGPPEFLCSSAGGAHMNGMAVMYALMSAFHAGPWIQLLARRRFRPAT